MRSPWDVAHFWTPINFTVRFGSFGRAVKFCDRPQTLRGAGHFKTRAGTGPGKWLRTGDKGWVDADGYLSLSGRFKEIINRGGEKISPFEVEDVLRSHRAVADLIAFAMPHQDLGEVRG